MPDVNNFDFWDTTVYDAQTGAFDVNAFDFIPTDIYNAGVGAFGVNNFDFISCSTTTPIAPVVSNVVPTTGSNILNTTAITFDVTDDLNMFQELIVIASFPSLGLLEIVHMDGVFGPQYNGLSTRTGIVNGFHYSVVRNGGWPGSPTIIIKAIDTGGAENV